jgi:hypothetical protein
VQRQILPRVSIDVSYFRRIFGNFLVTDNLAVPASGYNSFSITAPTNPLLPGGGGCNARLGGRFTLQGGMSMGRTTTDNCAILTQLPGLGGSTPAMYCHVDTPFLSADMTQKRKIIVHIATSADGYIARPDGNLDWLTGRPAPKGFYGMPKFMRSVDAKFLGRKTFDLSVEMGAHFSADDRHYVFSHQPPPASVPAGVEFVSQSIGAFARRLRDQAGKNIWI